MVSPSLKYIFLLLAWMIFFFFFYLCGLKPVAPRARFKCVWVFKDFSAEKPFGLQPHRHTLATELCHFRFLSHHWNQRKVQKRSKKHKTKADENGPDWIMSDLACASLWGKSSFCLITLCLTAKRIQKKKNKKGKAPLGSFENNSQIVTVNTGLKWCGLQLIFLFEKKKNKTGRKWRECVWGGVHFIISPTLPTQTNFFSTFINRASKKEEEKHWNRLRRHFQFLTEDILVSPYV